RPERPAAAAPGIAFPGVVAELARTRHRVETPELFPRLRVERGELAAHAAFPTRKTREPPAVGVDRGAGGAAAIARDFDVPHRFARALIERDQPAARLSAEHFVLGDRHAAILLLAVLRFVFPDQRAGRGVDRDD